MDFISDLVVVPEAAVRPGVRIRLVVLPTLTKPTVGTLLNLTEDSVTFRPANSGEKVHLSRSEVASFELSRGKKRNTAKGAAIGLFVGALLGGLAAIDKEECFLCPQSVEGWVVLGAVGGALRWGRDWDADSD